MTYTAGAANSRVVVELQLPLAGGDHMRRSFFGFALLVAGSLSFSPTVDACGAKFLVAARTPGYDKAHAAAQRGRILIYQNPSSDVLKALTDSRLKKSLERVGHHVDTVESSDAVDKAVASGKYDIVVAGVSDAEQLNAKVGSGDDSSVIVPVVYKASWTDVAELKKTFSCVLNAPPRTTQLLAMVDQALAAKKQ